MNFNTFLKWNFFQLCVTTTWWLTWFLGCVNFCYIYAKFPSFKRKCQPHRSYLLTCRTPGSKAFKEKSYSQSVHYRQIGSSFDSSSAILWCNVPTLIDILLDTTCDFQFEFALVSKLLSSGSYFWDIKQKNSTFYLPDSVYQQTARNNLATSLVH